MMNKIFLNLRKSKSFELQHALIALRFTFSSVFLYSHVKNLSLNKKKSYSDVAGKLNVFTKFYHGKFDKDNASTLDNITERYPKLYHS